MTAGIYQIKNVLNGHCYIGQSTNLESRKRDHFRRLKNNKHGNGHLQNAYKKYGKENFILTTLLYCEPFELTRYEQKLVDILNPKYNICRECVDSCKGIKHSEEAIRKTALANMGLKKSEETRHKISLAFIGNTYALGNTNWVGKHHSEESKLKMSLVRIGNTNGLGNTNMLGKHHSEEARHKMSLAQTGHKVSEEARHKMSLAKKGKKLTEEHKHKLSLARIGKTPAKGLKHTEESKLKMSLAQKARQERERLQRQGGG